jgi:transposase
MGVIIGMDPHKRSATVEVINDRGQILAVGRYGTDKTGYADMLRAGRKYEDRLWAIEGCNGIGKHIAHRLVHDGESVVDVPPKLSAQVRVFATGNGRKTTRSTRTRWRWSPCAPRTWSACRSTTTWS